jgi:hypothetical protein
MSEQTPSARKGEVHERLLARYAKFKSREARRDFRRRLSAFVGRSEQSVARWVGERLPMNGPPSTALDRCEQFLDGGA